KLSVNALWGLRAPSRKANLRGVFHSYCTHRDFALLFGISRGECLLSSVRLSSSEYELEA
ncbi:hypothetical protein, partial [Prevotella brunnea]|uniref:hypothetical protein n=1 Tax=Prevotella brunnea TaxID=2508867 RepID=UPI00283AA0B1